MTLFLKKLMKPLTNLINSVRFKIKLKQMDERWYNTGGNCFGLFPPSFYYTHSEEEIRHITAKTIKELREIAKRVE